MIEINTRKSKKKKRKKKSSIKNLFLLSLLQRTPSSANHLGDATNLLGDVRLVRVFHGLKKNKIDYQGSSCISALKSVLFFNYVCKNNITSNLKIIQDLNLNFAIQTYLTIFKTEAFLILFSLGQDCRRVSRTVLLILNNSNYKRVNVNCSESNFNNCINTL